MTTDGITLKDYMDRQFTRMEDALKEIRMQLIGRDKFEVACNKILSLEDVYRDHEKRIIQTERAVWLLSIIASILIPMVSAFIYALLTGSVQVTFK